MHGNAEFAYDVGYALRRTPQVGPRQISPIIMIVMAREDSKQQRSRGVPKDVQGGTN